MKNMLPVIVIAFLFSGCVKGENEFKCDYDACKYVAPSAEIQSVQSYLTSNNLTATQHCSGFFYTVDVPGSGTTPTVCNTVVVNYEGRLTNGTVFDKTQPGAPASFSLSQVITGFKNGLTLLKPGGKITLYIPPSLGYGTSQTGNIPPNSILIFSVELIGFQ